MKGSLAGRRILSTAIVVVGVLGGVTEQRTWAQEETASQAPSQAETTQSAWQSAPDTPAIRELQETLGGLRLAQSGKELSTIASEIMVPWQKIDEKVSPPWEKMSTRSKRFLTSRRFALQRVKKAIANPQVKDGFPVTRSYTAELPWLGNARPAVLLLVLQARQYEAAGREEKALENFRLASKLGTVCGRNAPLISSLVQYVVLCTAFYDGVFPFVKRENRSKEALRGAIAVCEAAELGFGDERWPLYEAAAFAALATDLAGALENPREASPTENIEFLKETFSEPETPTFGFLKTLAFLGITPESCRRDIKTFEDDMNIVLEACGKDYVSATKLLEPVEEKYGRKDQKLVLLATFFPDPRRALRERARTEVFVRMPGLFAAIRLYKMEKGSDPASLEDLAPDYLSSLPVDPFSNRPFVYASDTKGRFLYSVGPDLKDDKGKRTWDPDNRDDLEGDWIWRLPDWESGPD